MRHEISCVLPHNLALIYPDNISTFIGRYDVDKCNTNCREHGVVAQALLPQLNILMRCQSTGPELNWSAATCIFTIHNLNLYIFNDHITVSSNINNAWGQLLSSSHCFDSDSSLGAKMNSYE